MNPSHIERPAVNRTFGESLRFLLYLGVNLFVDARHRDENSRPHFQKKLRQLFEVRTVSQRNATIEQRDVRMSRRHMRQRQKGNANVASMNVETVQRIQHVRSQVAVRQLHSFRDACSS